MKDEQTTTTEKSLIEKKLIINHRDYKSWSDIADPDNYLNWMRGYGDDEGDYVPNKKY